MVTVVTADVVGFSIAAVGSVAAGKVDAVGSFYGFVGKGVCR